MIKYEGIKEIPKACINAQWLKTDNVLQQKNLTHCKYPDAETQATRYRVLLAACNKAAFLASYTDQEWEHLREVIATQTEILEELYKNRWQHKGYVGQTTNHVRGPKVVETKGTTKNSPRKCSICGYALIIITFFC